MPNNKKKYDFTSKLFKPAVRNKVNNMQHQEPMNLPISPSFMLWVVRHSFLGCAFPSKVQLKLLRAHYRTSQLNQSPKTQNNNDIKKTILDKSKSRFQFQPAIKKSYLTNPYLREIRKMDSHVVHVKEKNRGLSSS